MQRRQPLAEAGGHVERAQRAVPQQVDALQRAAQLGEQRVDLARDPRGPAADQMRDRRAMAARDLLEAARA